MITSRDNTLEYLHAMVSGWRSATLLAISESFLLRADEVIANATVTVVSACISRSAALNHACLPGVRPDDRGVARLFRHPLNAPRQFAILPCCLGSLGARCNSSNQDDDEFVGVLCAA